MRRLLGQRVWRGDWAGGSAKPWAKGCEDVTGQEEARSHGLLSLMNIWHQMWSDRYVVVSKQGEPTTGCTWAGWHRELSCGGQDFGWFVKILGACMLDIRCVNKENPINIDMIPSRVVQFSKNLPDTNIAGWRWLWNGGVENTLFPFKRWSATILMACWH